MERTTVTLHAEPLHAEPLHAEPLRAEPSDARTARVAASHAQHHRVGPARPAAGYRRPLPLRLGLTLTVASVHEQAPGVRSLGLVAPDGAVLPDYVPGSHLLVECGSAVNAYSLTGSGLAPAEYALSVQRDDAGAGGSAFLHRIRPGDRLRVSRPRNGFAPRTTATHHLLIAGGIGVTPVLSHLRAAAAWGRETTTIYAHRPGVAPHLAELQALCGDRLVECTGGRAPLQALLGEVLGRQPMGTHLYACGGSGVIDAVLAAARGLHWPEERVHVETFDTAALDPGEPFTVELQRSHRVLAVPPGVSLLEALEDEGVPVPNMCRQGVCGECRIPVTTGTVLHRDTYLSAEDRAANTSMMACVSRAGTDERLGVDL
jgi:dimethylamine monooxygenase subunit B